MNKQEMQRFLSENAAYYYGLSDDVWDHPEVRFTEKHSSKVLADALAENGFSISWNLAGLETAFCASWGAGKPVIGILGEFDALPELSQVAGIAEKKPVAAGGNGHGCGHNLLGVGSLIGAVGIQKYLEENGLPGTVMYFGCPAEEGGSGKTFMAREGCFNKLDFALTWHPAYANAVMPGSLLANCMIRYSFTGQAAHAAAAPERGRSALDALELMNMGIQFLREHIPSAARVHYAITDTGGLAPNVVQAHASGIYQIRAPFTPMVIDIQKRLDNIARGAALMTGTEAKIEFLKATSNTVPNAALDEVMYRNLIETPCPKNDGPDRALAEALMKTQLPQQRWVEKPISEEVMPYVPSDAPIPASSDVGDVSWVCPVSQVTTAAWPVGTVAHSWQAVACGKSNFAHKAMLYAGQVIAGSAVDLYHSPDTVQAAWAELKRRTQNAPYACPIPAQIDPNYVKEQMK